MREFLERIAAEPRSQGAFVIDDLREFVKLTVPRAQAPGADVPAASEA